MIINPQDIFKERVLRELSEYKQNILNNYLDSVYYNQKDNYSYMVGNNFKAFHSFKSFFRNSIGIESIPNFKDNSKFYKKLANSCFEIFFAGKLRKYLNIITESNFFELNQLEKTVLLDSGLTIFYDFHSFSSDKVPEDTAIILYPSEEVIEALRELYDEVNENFGIGYTKADQDIEF